MSQSPLQSAFRNSNPTLPSVKFVSPLFTSLVFSPQPSKRKRGGSLGKRGEIILPLGYALAEFVANIAEEDKRKLALKPWTVKGRTC